MVVYRKFEDDRTVRLFRARCKSWTCEYCAPRQQRAWREYLSKRLPEVSSSWWLMTITSPGTIRDTRASFNLIRVTIDTLMKRLKRIAPGAQYVRVFERHKSGAVHAHFIISDLPERVFGYVRRGKMSWTSRRVSALTPRHDWSIKTWLKRTTSALGLGYIADVRPCKDGGVQAMAYVTKYLTKDIQAIPVRNLRRVQTTRKIGGPNSRAEKQAGWLAAPRLLLSQVEPGWTLRDMDLSRTFDQDELANIPGSVYPPVIE